jgi:hypothetical protein
MLYYEYCPTGAVLLSLPVSVSHSVSLMLCFQILGTFLISYHMGHPFFIDGVVNVDNWFRFPCMGLGANMLLWARVSAPVKFVTFC